MASRAVEAGTVIARVQWLLSCGVLKERPLWLDVVERLPPLSTPQYNRKPDPGRLPTLWYKRDHLVRELEEKYEVLKAGQPYNSKIVISLFEDRRGDSEGCPPSLIDLIVKEQMRFMDLGKSKADSLEAAIDQLSAANKDVVITLKPGSSHRSGQIDPQPK